MVRRRRPQIAGRDPEYTSDFAAKLPTNMPEAEPIAEKVEAAPSPARKEKAPTTQRAASKPKPKAVPVPETKGQGEKRLVALTSAITTQHYKKLEALSKHGIAQKDAMSLAGRRATDRFEPKPKFVEKPEAERMPMRQGYKTTKVVDAKLIDTLREKHDPLKLLSDGAMLRGQFEPLFWKCMDEVIAELTERFGS